MPKFMTYQRPTPVRQTQWNGGPKKAPAVPRKAPELSKQLEVPPVPKLDDILHKH